MGLFLKALLAVEQIKSNSKLQMKEELLTQLGEAAGSLKVSYKKVVNITEPPFSLPPFGMLCQWRLVQAGGWSSSLTYPMFQNRALMMT